MSQPREILGDIRYWAQQGWRVSRFLSQSLLGRQLLGRKTPPELRETLPNSRDVLKDLFALLARDREYLRSGLYRVPSGDALENPVEFAKSSFRVFRDLASVYRRQKDKDVQDIPESVSRAQFPRYYTQNFHFQTDGYLSEESADLYDHQVEMVFGGGADVMRRMTFPWIESYLREQGFSQANSSPDRVFNLLDVACGTGRYLNFLKTNLPELHVTGTDLSPFYLQKARKMLSNFARADFVESNAEKLPFVDGLFDVVTSIFLFHELPDKARRASIAEMARVLKPGGLMILEDSIQVGDKPDFDGALADFPRHYHEPFYASYVKTAFEPIFRELGLELRDQERVWFSKIWILRKPA